MVTTYSACMHYGRRVCKRTKENKIGEGEGEGEEGGGTADPAYWALGGPHENQVVRWLSLLTLVRARI